MIYYVVSKTGVVDDSVSDPENIAIIGRKGQVPKNVICLAPELNGAQVTDPKLLTVRRGYHHPDGIFTDLVSGEPPEYYFNPITALYVTPVPDPALSYYHNLATDTWIEGLPDPLPQYWYDVSVPIWKDNAVEPAVFPEEVVIDAPVSSKTVKPSALYKTEVDSTRQTAREAELAISDLSQAKSAKIQRIEDVEDTHIAVGFTFETKTYACDKSVRDKISQLITSAPAAPEWVIPWYTLGFQELVNLSLGDLQSMLDVMRTHLEPIKNHKYSMIFTVVNAADIAAVGAVDETAGWP